MAGGCWLPGSFVCSCLRSFVGMAAARTSPSASSALSASQLAVPYNPHPCAQMYPASVAARLRQAWTLASIERQLLHLLLPAVFDLTGAQLRLCVHGKLLVFQTRQSLCMCPPLPRRRIH